MYFKTNCTCFLMFTSCMKPKSAISEQENSYQHTNRTWVEMCNPHRNTGAICKFRILISIINKKLRHVSGTTLDSKHINYVALISSLSAANQYICVTRAAASWNHTLRVTELNLGEVKTFFFVSCSLCVLYFSFYKELLRRSFVRSKCV